MSQEAQTQWNIVHDKVKNVLLCLAPDPNKMDNQASCVLCYLKKGTVIQHGIWLCEVFRASFGSNSCFACFGKGHQTSQCPNKRQVQDGLFCFGCLMPRQAQGLHPIGFLGKKCSYQGHILKTVWALYRLKQLPLPANSPLRTAEAAGVLEEDAKFADWLVQEGGDHIMNSVRIFACVADTRNGVC